MKINIVDLIQKAYTPFYPNEKMAKTATGVGLQFALRVAYPEYASNAVLTSKFIKNPTRSMHDFTVRLYTICQFGHFLLIDLRDLAVWVKGLIDYPAGESPAAHELEGMVLRTICRSFIKNIQNLLVLLKGRYKVSGWTRWKRRLKKFKPTLTVPPFFRELVGMIQHATRHLGGEIQ